MADNPVIDNGGGGGANFTAAGDDVAVNGGPSAVVQYVKLVDGRSGGTDGLPGSLNDGLYVTTYRESSTISVASAGLTIATTAYTAGDQMGSIFTLAGAARISGGGGLITGVKVIDAADVIGPVDVMFFDRSVTLAADNAAFAISDADALFCVGLAQLSGAFDIGNNRLAQQLPAAIPYNCNVTSLYAAIITRSGHTFFGATGNLQLIVNVERY